MSATNSLAVVNPAPSPASLVPLAEVIKTAEIIVQSGLFPAFKTPQAAAALMLLCRSKGLDPMQAVERYHIVQGRPVMRADAMLAEFIQGGGRIEWHERTEKIARATFSHPQGGSVEVAWTLDMAKSANLTGKDVWRQYPRQMLHARCVSEGVRSVYPGATNGLYTPEEAENMEPIRATATVEPSARPALPASAPARTVEAPATSQAQRDLGSPASPAKRQPTALEIEAISEFGETCSREGIDVMDDGPDPKFSRTKMAAEVRRLLGLKPDAEVSSIGMWKAATVKLKASGAAPAPAKAAGQPMRRTTPEPPADELGEMEDPFADDPTGVLSAPPAATNGTGRDADF